jgi:Tol biopolymer transport system component
VTSKGSLTRRQVELAESGRIRHVSFSEDRDTEFPAEYRSPLGTRYKRGGMFIGSWPLLAPDGSSILFSSPDKRTLGDIFLIRRDCSQRTCLRSTDYYQGQARFSPDGSTIVFISEEVDGILSVFVMDASGQNARRLTSSDYHEGTPIFSPNGKKIYFHRLMSYNLRDAETHGELFVIDIDGRNERRLTDNWRSEWPAGVSRDEEELFYTAWDRTRTPQGQMVLEKMHL